MSSISQPVALRQRRELSEEQLVRMNIGRRYWKATIDQIPKEARHRQLIERYVADLTRMRRTGWGLFLWGKNNRGKTFAATAILKEAVLAGFTAFCVASDELKTSFIDGERFDPDQTIFQRVRSVDFLLIEDLGKEYIGKGSGWAELCFENLIRFRSRNLLPTHVTTNLTKEEFVERYKQSSAALTLEMMVPVNVQGPNFRELMQQQMLTHLKE